MKIYCCNCEKKIETRLTNGAEICPDRKEIHHLPFWKCDTCGYNIGCHHKTKNRTQPLGHIATPELNNARILINSLLNSIWCGGKLKRYEVYNKISEHMGFKYQTAYLRSLKEANKVYEFLQQLERDLLWKDKI